MIHRRCDEFARCDACQWSESKRSELFFPRGNGEALVAEIPDATLLTAAGVPRATWPTVVEALLRHTEGR